MAELEFDAEDLPFSTLYGDHYFSRHDGRAETAHVFLAGNGLPERWLGEPRFTIGELGFGTGLNFLETWRQWQESRRDGQRLDFVSIEAHPLEAGSVRRALGRWPELQPLATTLLSHWPLPNAVFISLDAQTRLMVVEADVATALADFPPEVDAWYLDGFAPARNPAMWSETVARLIVARSAEGATLASYTAAGWVRRNFEAAGFSIEKRPGFGTKRDMIVGRFGDPAAS